MFYIRFIVVYFDVSVSGAKFTNVF